MAALQEFYVERDTKEKEFEDLKTAAENDFENEKPISMALFGESWQDSQFWYTDETATTLAEQLLDGVTEESWIGVVSAPSVYVQLRNLLVRLVIGTLGAENIDMFLARPREVPHTAKAHTLRV